MCLRAELVGVFVSLNDVACSGFSLLKDNNVAGTGSRCIPSDAFVSMVSSVVVCSSVVHVTL